MRPRKRDPAFLRMAAVAAVGGVLAIAFAIGFPLWAERHGRSSTPAFMLFAAWGFAALAGAYACLQTYFLSDPPGRPPHGGVPLKLVHDVDAVSALDAPRGERDRRAA
jgi:hypothetical protein